MARKKKENGGGRLGVISTIIAILVGCIAIYEFFFKDPSSPPPNPKVEVTVIPPPPSPNKEPSVFTLPSGPEKLVGREEDIAQAVKLLRQGKDVLISGAPGMMQRETALAAARRLQKENLFPDGILFHEAGEGHGEIDLMDALFLQLGDMESLKYKPDPKPSLFSRVLGGKNILLVLDNIHSNNIFDFLSKHKAGASILVSATGAIVPAGVETISLKPLKDQDAVRLFKDNYLQCSLLGVEEEKNIGEICRLLDNNPFPVLLAGRRCSVKQDKPSDLLAELKQKNRLDVLNVPGGAGKENSLLAAVSVVFQRLSEGAQEAYRSTAVFPSGTFSREALKEVIGRDAGSDLDLLLLAGLVDRTETGGERYSLPPVLRDFAEKLLEEKKGEGERLRASALKYFVGYAKNAFGKWKTNDYKESFSLFQQEMDNIRGLRKWAWEKKKWKEASDLFNYCYLYLRNVGRYEEELEWGLGAVQTAEKMGDRQELALNANNLGQIYQDQGDLENALLWTMKAKDIDEGLGNKPSLAISYGNLSAIYEARGEKEEAEKYRKLKEDVAKELKALNDKKTFEGGKQ